ncbi:helix-turn-helix domain-containing protein [Methylobacterium isbiliense]|nr:hypothetical protein [Methylobacterium isbiliense]MDN3626016.1 hypothetical protein [Methylobacterium isbiliense]
MQHPEGWIVSMTPAEFKATLRRLGRTQIGFASEIGVSRRTIHLWAERGPPAYAVYLLGLIERYGVRAAQEASTKPILGDAAAVLDDMYARAASEGVGTDFVDVVEHWLRIHSGTNI